MSTRQVKQVKAANSSVIATTLLKQISLLEFHQSQLELKLSRYTGAADASQSELSSHYVARQLVSVELAVCNEKLSLLIAISEGKVVQPS